ncbi:GGDEF domain-containing protein [Streptacidiphilus cavernicola]|uniref:GGDEF domain-containing protein n=1 Tax=Streptacidiphilus cavernicola TaxID=3342716 RepID=A0ABV6VND5_9ACTN
MPTDLSANQWTAVLAALLLIALLAVAVVGTSLRRTRRIAAAHTQSLRQEVERLQHSRAELERTSYTDPLTGVWNYRYLQLSLDREIARCARNPQPDGADRLALLLLEVEGFDRIRREHGHQRGGAVLRDLAQRLAMEVREADVFGRYGGEEFLVLLPDTDAAGAEHVAERLRWTVRRHPLALPAVPVPALVAADGPSETGVDAASGAGAGSGAAPENGLSAAIGIAVLPRDGGHAALLLRAADQALAAARAPGTVPGTVPEVGLKVSETSTSQPVYALLAQGCDLSLNAESRP